MLPLITTHQDVVRLERALQLARLEKKRSVRNQELTYVSHSKSQADNPVGLASLRAHLGSLLISLGKAVYGREALERAGRLRQSPHGLSAAR